MKKHLVALAAAACAFGTAHAGPADHVQSPNVEKGEQEIEFRAGSFRDHGREVETAGGLSYGVGITSWWATEIGIEYSRERGERFRYDSFEWENKFQFAKAEQHGIDMAVLLEIERARDHDEGWGVALGLLMQKDFGKLQTNLNLLLGRSFDAEESSDTEFGYQWQLKYPVAAAFQVGVQGFGEVGEWNDWAKSDAQQHKAGPAIFGSLPLGGDDALKYDVGFLFGMTKDTPEHTLRVKLDYEF